MLLEAIPEAIHGKLASVVLRTIWALAARCRPQEREPGADHLHERRGLSGTPATCEKCLFSPVGRMMITSGRRGNLLPPLPQGSQSLVDTGHWGEPHDGLPRLPRLPRCGKEPCEFLVSFEQSRDLTC